MKNMNVSAAEEPSSVGDLIDENEFDSETECEDIDVSFEKTYEILCEKAVSLQNIYLLHLSACFQDSTAKLVAGLSDYRCVVYDLNSNLSLTFSSDAHKDVITDVKILSEDEQQFFTGSLDGTIKLWDLRTKAEPALIFKDDSDGEHKLKPINCFDVSSDRKFICGGTPLVEADSYLLFWDSRKSSILGGYWETHTDDITQVKFNSSRANLMLSGSTDGLVNVFDVSCGNEDDALLNSLNIDAAVRKLQWLEKDQKFGCITDMETLQLWRVDDAESFQNFDRQTLGKSIKMKSWDNAYVSDIYMSLTNDILVLSGSNLGKGDYLKLSKYTDGQLNPYASFENNKQLIRCSGYNVNRDIFVTAGESGIISVWRSQNSNAVKMCFKERAKKKRIHKVTI